MTLSVYLPFKAETFSFTNSNDMEFIRLGLISCQAFGVVIECNVWRIPCATETQNFDIVSAKHLQRLAVRFVCIVYLIAG